MSDWPIVDRAPVQLPTVPGHDDELWAALVVLAGLRPGEWTLVGGQMVFLHALEHGAVPPRVSTDLDVLVNARIVAGGVRRFVAGIEERGFELVGASPEGIAHRYRRNGVSIDVLAPEGLGPRADLTTTPPGRTLQVPGGTQALDRTELVPSRTATPKDWSHGLPCSEPSSRRRSRSMSTTRPTPNGSTSLCCSAWSRIPSPYATP